MVCTTRTGSASGASSLAYARYVIEGALETEQMRAAQYYVGDVAGRDVQESVIQLREDMSPALAKRLGIDPSRPLTLTETANLINCLTADGREIEGRKKHSAHRSVADVFGLDAKALPSVAEIENVLGGKRADGAAPRSDSRTSQEEPSRTDVLGQAVQSGEISYSDALDELVREEMDRAPPTADLDIDAMEERLRKDLADATGRAAIGATKEPKPLSDKRIASAVRQFKIAIGVPTDRDATSEEIQRVADGRMDVADYHGKINATNPPVGFVDLTLSTDKTIGICYAHAKSQAERDIILEAVRAAKDDAMAYVETVLGVARRGGGGMGEAEPASMTYLSVPHFSARPATDIVRLDAQGQEYTDTRSVPGSADVNLHWHNLIPSTVMTASGRVAALDTSRLDGEVKVIGAVFHAGVATRLRAAGIAAEIGPNGEARIPGIADWVRKFHSRRSMQGQEAAKEWAASRGKDWNRLDGDEKAKLLSEGVSKTREAKTKRPADEGLGDIATWQADAKAAGYKHRSVLRSAPKVPARTREQRIEFARNASLDLLDKAFQKRAVLSDGDVREIAARGLITAGLGANAAADINAIVQTYDEQGVRVNGLPTTLIRGTEIGENGRARKFVTTERAIEQEHGLMDMVRTGTADRSTALTAEQIERAAERFLAAHPTVDREGAQWKSQLAMAHGIGEGGRVSLSIGVAGSGKTSSVVATLVDAWHEDGRTVYGMTVPWKASTALRDAGVDQAVAIAAFLNRVEKGKIHVDENTVIVADEVSQIGIRHQLALLKLATETGAQLVEIGDPKQCGSVETPAIELIAKAIGDDAIPKLLTTIRQKHQRDRDVATMFRNANAADGIAALQEDGRFHLIAGGTKSTIEQTTALWRKMTDANKHDPDYSLLVMTPTNTQAREVGLAIRDNRRAAGEIGNTDVVLKAMDPNSGETFSLPVTEGDKLRMFTRTFDADTPGRSKVLSSNGDVVQVMAVLPDGLRIRNDAGDEGRVTWSQMKPFRAPKNDPVMVTMGYAVTIDTAQSLTRSAAILAMPDGSKQVSGYKAYTGLSRHVGYVHLVASDAAERREIVGRQMLGQYALPTQKDVVRNIADNLSRFQAKSQATDVLQRAIAVRHSAKVSARQAAEPHERQMSRDIPTPSRYEHWKMSHVFDRLAEFTRQVKHKVEGSKVTQAMRDAAMRQFHTGQAHDTQAAAHRQQAPSQGQGLGR